MENDRRKSSCRRVTWWWWVLAAAFVLFVAVVGVLRFMGGDLAPVARIALKSALPGATVDMGEVRMEAPGEFVFSDLVISDPVTGRELVRLERGRAVFTFQDLARRRIGELRLENPLLHISPGWSGVLPQPDAGELGGMSLEIRRIVCDYGEVVYGEGDGLRFSAKFCLDWSDFSVAGTEPLELVLWDVQGAAAGQEPPFLVIDLARISGVPVEMFERSELRSVDIRGGLLAVGPAIGKAATAAPKAGSLGASAKWRIGALRVRDVKAFLGYSAWQDEGDVTFLLNTDLSNLSPEEMTRELGGTMQVVELVDIVVPSPRDPFTQVLTLRSVFLGFTLAGILRAELEEVRILHPVIHVGEELFLYMEDARKKLATDRDAATDGQPAWKITRLEVAFGSLLIGSAGRRQYGLPLNFHTQAENVSLDDLASLSIKGGMEIPAEHFRFPAYQIEAETKLGSLLFSYPPEKGVENIVGTVGIPRLRWRQFTADDAWVTATFDRSGIHGRFGGRFCSGVLEGGASFFFEETSPWIGWFSGTGIDLRELTDVLAPESFSLTGPLDIVLQTNARAGDIQRIEGKYTATQPGRMTIRKIDDLLARIPSDWVGLKKDAVRVALESLRDFDYDGGGGSFSFAGGQGVVDLRLQGPSGSRNFTAHVHKVDSPDSAR